MFYKQSLSRKIFIIFNVIILSLITILGILPFIHLFSVSVSSNLAAMSGEVKFWPKGFTMDAYGFLSNKPEFIRSLVVSVKRVILGTSLSMFLVLITAYPLSKRNDQFRARTAYMWFFAITMFFTGGLIPTYIVVKNTGIMNSIWALVLPGALNVWNMIMMVNFFRGIPREMEEAAMMDGANHWTILWKMYLPVSLPALATIGMFTIVVHWNSWFDGILYMNSPTRYPLQTYLYTLINAMKSQLKIVSSDDLGKLSNLSEKTLRSAQIFMGALPIMLVYPFMQKYFVKGIMVGSLKE